MVETNEQLGEQIETPIKIKWTEKHGYKTTKGYIDMLKRTGKIGSPSYQRWVKAGRPMMSDKVGFKFEDWAE